MSSADTLLPSPCVGICELDEATGWCIGCGREGDELFGWGELSEREQRAIWAKLPERLTKLERDVRLLPWSGAALIDRLIALTTAPGTVWSVGVSGASAEFLGTADAPVVATRDRGGLVARHPGGALRIETPAGLRGFLSTRRDGAELVLALHNARVRTTSPSVLTELGVDQTPLAASAPAPLFDLGVGAGGIRFCVRATDRALVGLLRTATGLPILQQPELLAVLAGASPTRVLLSPVGRIEVTSRIPPRDGASPAGPHTHLLPDRIDSATDRRLGVPLPDGYVACARVFIRPEAAAGVIELA